MQIGDAFDDGEPEAAAVRFDIGAAVKAVEDARELCRRNAGAVILHAERDAVGIGGDGDDDPAALGTVADGIVQQVVEDEGEGGGIAAFCAGVKRNSLSPLRPRSYIRFGNFPHVDTTLW